MQIVKCCAQGPCTSLQDQTPIDEDARAACRIVRNLLEPVDEALTKHDQSRIRRSQVPNSREEDANAADAVAAKMLRPKAHALSDARGKEFDELKIAGEDRGEPGEITRASHQIRDPGLSAVQSNG